ncbi:hypothetical protein JCM13991_21660 [Thermodesulfovibrio hydrogeniphilus]
MLRKICDDKKKFLRKLCDDDKVTIASGRHASSLRGIRRMPKQSRLSRQVRDKAISKIAIKPI